MLSLSYYLLEVSLSRSRHRNILHSSDLSPLLLRRYRVRATDL